MQDVQTGTRFLRQLYGQCRRMVTSFFTTYQRMERNVQVFAILLLEAFGIFADNLLVFTMGGNQHARFGEYFFQGCHAVYQHVSGAGPHEQFHAAYVCLVQCLQLVGIIVCGSEIERIIDNTFGSRILKLVFQCL